MNLLNFTFSESIRILILPPYFTNWCTEIFRVRELRNSPLSLTNLQLFRNLEIFSVSEEEKFKDGSLCDSVFIASKNQHLFEKYFFVERISNRCKSFMILISYDTIQYPTLRKAFTRKVSKLSRQNSYLNSLEYKRRNNSFHVVKSRDSNDQF